MDQHEMPFPSDRPEDSADSGEPRGPAGAEPYTPFAAVPESADAAADAPGAGAAGLHGVPAGLGVFGTAEDGVPPGDPAGTGGELERASGRTVAVYGPGGLSGSGGQGRRGDAPADAGDVTAFGVDSEDDASGPYAGGGAESDDFSPFGVSADGDTPSRLAAGGTGSTPFAPVTPFTPFDTGTGGAGGHGSYGSAAGTSPAAGAQGGGFSPFAEGGPAGGRPAGGGFDAFGVGAAGESRSGGGTGPGLGAGGIGVGTGTGAGGGTGTGIGGGIGGGSGTGSFDGFAAGAGRAEPRPLPVLPVVDESTSLFDSTKPVPRMTRPARDPLAPDLGAPGGAPVRVPLVVAADFLLTVNGVDGTEVVPCPPEERRTPVRRTREDRAARMAAARPAPPPGPPAPELPLLERDEERDRLIKLLARGRSVRVTGASGTGRTALLDSVANACGDLAPEGVLRLSGYRRTAADVLQDLYALVYATEGHRPARDELPGLLGDFGAVVVLDDLEFGGAALEEVLETAPECAFLMSATPDVPVPDADSMVEELFLSGLTRTACLDLLQLAAARRLEEDEAAWAADLWFESEGLPLRFVQAGALLRQRDALRLPPEPPEWDDSVWENGSPAPVAPDEPALPDLSAFDTTFGGGFEPPEEIAAPGSVADAIPAAAVRPHAARLPASEVPLPSLAESAAPAELLASRLSESAREALAFAVALDGECPHPSHLPALVGDTHGDAALSELTSVGLAVPVASHFRLAAGVAQQLSVTLAADGELSDVQAHTAALHYAWWTGHPSVVPERAAAESEAILAAMSACRDGGHASAAVLLARTVAPVFAAALHWGAWERALRIGQEAARLSGEVAEEAYFHHELGVLALCTGNTDRARAELEASIALRGALADRQGTVVGRRTLALVLDKDLEPGGDGVAAMAAPGLPPGEPAPVVISKGMPPAGGAGGSGPSLRRLAVVGSRRNLVAAGTGVVLAAVVGTFVTLGATSGGGNAPNQVQPIESVEQNAPGSTQTPPADGTTASPPPASTSSKPSKSASASTTTTGGAASSQPGGVTSPPGVPVPPPATGGNPGGGPTQTWNPRPTQTTSTPPKPTPPTPTPTPDPTTTTPTPTPTTTTPSTGSTSGTTSQSATATAPVTRSSSPTAPTTTSNPTSPSTPSSASQPPSSASGPASASASDSPSIASTSASAPSSASAPGSVSPTN